MLLLDGTSDKALREIGLSHEILGLQYFMENSFFNDIFSHGPIHIAGVTLSALPEFMRNTKLNQLRHSNMIIPLLKSRAEMSPNRKKWLFFADSNKFDFLDCTLIFGRTSDDYLRFKQVGERESVLNWISHDDCSFIQWMLRHNKKGDNSAEYQHVRRLAIAWLEEVMDAIIYNFHSNIVNNDNLGEYGKSKEVVIRQTAMAFWAAISMRNLLQRNDFRSTDYNYVYQWDFGLAHPCKKFEELCNVVNKTNYDYVSKVYNAEFTAKEYEGHKSVVDAIIKTI